MTISYPSHLDTENLVDLATYGIHLTNRQGICHVCKSTIDRNWSDGYSLNARCENCYKQKRDAGLEYEEFNSQTVRVFIAQRTRDASEEFKAIMKIDGRLVHGRLFSGSTYDLSFLDTGEVINPLSLISLSEHTLERIYATQDNPKVVYARVVQLWWPAMKEKVSSEVGHHANWLNSIPFFDIGHGGRGFEEGGRVFVRLYLRLKEPQMLQKDDFELLDIQLVKEANAPFLDGFEVTGLNPGLINLKWSQAGAHLIKALAGIKGDWETGADEKSAMQKKIDQAKEHVAALAARYTMPTDAWISLIVENDSFQRSEHKIGHALDRIMIHPNY